jgi:transcriptional regulator with XRE-family HTH domain
MLMSERPANHVTSAPKSAEFEAGARLTRLRLELALAMQTVRASVGLTQKELADRLGVNQPAIAKLERVGDHKIESIVRYLGELDAELMVAVRQGDDAVQVSDDRVRLLVALPREVDDWAAAAGMDLDAFVMQALREARAKTLRRDARRGEVQPADPV